MNLVTNTMNATRSRSTARQMSATLVMFAAVQGIVSYPIVRAGETGAAAPVDSEAREQRVLAFVGRHQPELAELLSRLAKRKPDDYAAAVADLDRKVLALETDRSKDDRLYEAGLRAWQARTQADVLVARWIAGGRKDRAAIEPQLRAAIDAELDARAEHLEIRKQRSAAWYDRQIVRLRDKRDEAVASRMNELLGAQDQKSKEKKPTPAPAGRP